MAKYSKVLMFIGLHYIFHNADCMKVPTFSIKSKYEELKQKTFQQRNQINAVYINQKSIFAKVIECIENYNEIYAFNKKVEIAKIGKRHSKKNNGRAVPAKRSNDKDNLKRKIYQLDALTKRIVNELKLITQYPGNYSSGFSPFLDKIEVSRLPGGVSLTFSSQNSLDIFFKYIEDSQKKAQEQVPSITDFVFYLEDLLIRIDRQRLYNIQDDIFESKQAEATYKREWDSLEHSLEELNDLDMSIYFDDSERIAEQDESSVFIDEMPLPLKWIAYNSSEQNSDGVNDSMSNSSDAPKMIDKQSELSVDIPWRKIINDKLATYFSNWINEKIQTYEIDIGEYRAGDLRFFNIIYNTLIKSEVDTSIARKLCKSISEITMCFLSKELIPFAYYEEFEKQLFLFSEYEYWNNVLELLQPYSTIERHSETNSQRKEYSPITLTLSDSLIKVE